MRLWKLPDLWTRTRTRAHEVLGRRQTDAGAHSYHRHLLISRRTATALPSAASSAILTAAYLDWPVFKCSSVAGFGCSVTDRRGV